MKIATWNINSVRARLPNLLAWAQAEKPDVICLQELKCTADQFPAAEIEQAGYHAVLKGQKSWNGVAILSREKPEDVLDQLPGDETDEQARYIEATVNGIRIASIYLPNGNPVDSEKFSWKLAWMDRLTAHARNLMATDLPLILAGDYNAIPEAIDCHDPAAWEGDALFRPETRRRFRAMTFAGLSDAFRALNPPAPGQYSFWDYQAGAWDRDHGIRIDHHLVCPRIADRLSRAWIDRAPRGAEKASDHTPVVIEIADHAS